MNYSKFSKNISMIDLQQLKIIAQLLDNMDIIENKLERAYNDNDAENFNRAKTEILDIQNKISSMYNSVV
jgi:hypothetical protein